MKSGFMCGSFGLLLLVITYFATETEGLPECGVTNCTRQPSNLCSTLLGRASGHVAPPSFPVDLRVWGLNDLVLQLILEQTNSPRTCYEFAIHLLCLIAAPPCNPNTSSLILLCPETCLALKMLISSGVCNSFLSGTIQHFEQMDETSENIPYFVTFNCSDPATYFLNSTAGICDDSTSSCTNLFSPASQELLLKTGSLSSCVPLIGSPCKALFPNQFNNAIQIPGRANQEEAIFKILADTAPLLDDTCNRLLNLTVCSYIHPPCNEKAEQIPLCDCERTRQIIWEHCHLTEILNTLNVTMMSPFFDTIMQLNCSDPATYLIPVDNTSCSSIADLLDISGDDDGNNSFLRAPYIGAIVGGAAMLGLLVVLLTVTVIVLCTRARARHKMKIQMAQKLSQSLTLSNLQKEVSGRYQRERPECDGEFEETLPEKVKRELELQFGSSVVGFSSLTVDTESCLGQGAFGKVYSGSMEIGGTKTVVAIKTIKRLSTEEQLQSSLAESLIMKDLKHPHVLGLLGVCFDTPEHSPYIILPFMANGSVKNFLRGRRVHPTNFDDFPVGLKFGDLVQMCIEIAEGMKYLTDNKFVHRDLAARNCMVNEEGTVLVGDFGLARDVYSTEYYRSGGNVKLPVKWMSPETLNDGISNEKTDVWSYGVTCWEVFSLGRSPYPGIENHEILQYISSGGRLNKPTLCPDKLYTLLFQCWSSLPEDRPSFSELCVHLKDYWDEEHLYVIQSVEV